MKTVLGNILVTATQKEMVMNHPYLQSSELGFKFNFQLSVKAEIDPFENMEYTGEQYYIMATELDAMGWIAIGQIFERTKVTI